MSLFKKTDNIPQLEIFSALPLQTGRRASKKYKRSMACHGQFFSMLTYKIYFVLIIFILSLHPLSAASWHIVAKSLPFFYQLYSNEVFDIHQDKQGYLWIGTTSALIRYDGFRLRTFRSDYLHPFSLTSNGVIYMADNNRYLFVGTDRGVTIYDKQTWQTRSLPDRRIANRTINDVAADAVTGEIWMASGNHVYRSTPDGSSVRDYMLMNGGSDTGFHQLYFDRSRRLWAMSESGLFLFDSRRDRFVKYPRMPEGSPYTMYEDRQGNHWIGTWGHGLWLLDTKKKTYKKQQLKVSNSNSDDPIIYSIVQDDVFGYLWMLSYKELHTLKYVGGRLKSIDISKVIDPHKMFTKIVKDREGNLWLGSYDMGYLLSFYRSDIVSYPLVEINSLLNHDANLLSLCFSNGRLWMGQDRYGLLGYNAQTGQLQTFGALGYGEIAHMRPSRRGGFWASPRGTGEFVRFLPSGTTLRKVETISLESMFDAPGYTRDFHEDAKGNLWILTGKGLYLRRPGSPTISIAGEGVPLPDAITADSKGTIWAVKGHSLYRLSFYGNNVSAVWHASFPRLLENEKGAHLCVDAKGCLWMSTTFDRLVRSNPQKRRFMTNSIIGLPDGALQSMLSSGDKMWLMTNKVIRCIDINTLQETDYNSNSGSILVAAFRGEALCPDGHGGIIAGGHGGVVHISGNTGASSNAANRHYLVTDVLVGDSSALFDHVDPDSRESRIFLPANSRDIRICVSPLLFKPQATGALQCLLEGVDRQWKVVPSHESTAFYSQIPRGSHRFLVRWRKADGSWTAPQLLTTIVRRAAWYETPIAFAGYALAAIFTVFLIVRSIIRRTNQSALRHYHSQTRIGMLVDSTKPGNGQTGDSGKMTSFTDSDNTFLSQVMELVEKHMNDTEYGQEQLARDMLMSRSTLYRRIKAVSGLSPIEFLRNVKMKRAEELLLQHRLSISEIAYELGFSSPKYFTKIFKEETGMTPSEYQKQGNS